MHVAEQIFRRVPSLESEAVYGQKLYRPRLPGLILPKISCTHLSDLDTRVRHLLYWIWLEVLTDWSYLSHVCAKNCCWQRLRHGHLQVRPFADQAWSTRTGTCTRTYSSTVFFSTQLYSILCKNYEYTYSYLLEYWSKKPSTHVYFLSTTEYFFCILKLFYSREIYIKVSKYLESFKTLISQFNPICPQCVFFYRSIDAYNYLIAITFDIS